MHPTRYIYPRAETYKGKGDGMKISYLWSSEILPASCFLLLASYDNDTTTGNLKNNETSESGSGLLPISSRHR